VTRPPHLSGTHACESLVPTVACGFSTAVLSSRGTPVFFCPIFIFIFLVSTVAYGSLMAKKVAIKAWDVGFLFLCCFRERAMLSPRGTPAQLTTVMMIIYLYFLKKKIKRDHDYLFIHWYWFFYWQARLAPCRPCRRGMSRIWGTTGRGPNCTNWISSFPSH